MKQVAQYTKVVSHVWDIISKAREEWEVESSSRTGIQQTSSLTDTHALVVAIGLGKGLKNTMAGAPLQPGMMVPPAAIRPSTPTPLQTAGIGKAPSGIKTNIKSAPQVHPYAR